MPPQTPAKPKDDFSDIAEDPFAGIAEGTTPPAAAAAAPKSPWADVPTPAPFDEQKWYRSQPWPVRMLSSFESGWGIPRSVQRGGSHELIPGQPGQDPNAGLREAGQGIKAALLHPSLELESLRSIYNGFSTAQQ